MVPMELTKEDNYEIKKLAVEILSKAHSVNFKSFSHGIKGNYRERFIDVPAKELAKRQRRDRFSFYSDITVSFALYMFISNIYNAKHIAKNIYIRTEDEKFKEQFDALIPLGKVMLADGTMEESSMIEVEIKVTNPEKRSNHHGMPFEFVSVRLINSAA